MRGKWSELLNRRNTTRQQALYAAWVDEFSTDLYRMAYRLCGNTDTAEDLTQETFYHAWKDMNRLRDSDKARAWLFQILRHRYAHWVRDRARRIKPTASVADVEHLMATTASPLANVMDRDTLQTALDKLEEPIRITLLMVFLEGMTCREAAEALDLPLGTVLSRIHRARQHLRSTMDMNIQGGEPSVTEARGNCEPRRLRFGGDS